MLHADKTAHEAPRGTGGVAAGRLSVDVCAFAVDVDAALVAAALVAAALVAAALVAALAGEPVRGDAGPTGEV
jgi:hypothetical protein